MTGYTPTPDFYNDYIAHHGIKGQKWGVRNGPPYPLSKGAKSSEKKTSSGTKSDGKTPEKSRILYGSAKAGKSKKISTDEEIDRQVDKTKIHRRVEKWSYGEYVDRYGDFKVGDYKIRIRGEDASDEEIKNVARDILKNKDNLVDSCVEAMKDSYVPYWIPDGMSEKDFYDGLDLKSADIYKWPKSTTVDLSFWEKDESSIDLMGGHSINIEVSLDDLRNRKRKISGDNVSING